MFRAGSTPGNPVDTNVLLADGGVGDHICALVAVDFIIKNYPWINPIIWVPDFLLDYAKHVLPGANIRNYTQAKTEYDATLAGVTTQWKGRHTGQRTHPVDYAFHMLTDSHQYDNSKRNYLQIRPYELDISQFNLPKKYIVICPVAVEQVKRFHPLVVNQVSDYCNSKGYTPVYIGREDYPAGEGENRKAKITPANYTKGINLINQTSLLETAAVIAGAKAFIGMDGGPVHIAGSTQTPIVAGYTFISPEHNIPIRNGIPGDKCYTIVPEEDLGCRFCQTNWSLMFGTDFRSCAYQDYECVSRITFKRIRPELEKIICEQ
jgi:ADP-heptose:LPS heptosyltransferase